MTQGPAWPWAWQLAATTLLSGCGGDAPKSVPTDAGFSALTDWTALPLLGANRTTESSSRDRVEGPEFTGVEPGNKDFNSFTAVCGGRPPVFLESSDNANCDKGVDGYVIASADDGPGFVSRIFLAAGTAGSGTTVVEGFADERIRIFVDDLSHAAFDGAVSDLEKGNAAPFAPPLTSHKSGTVVSYVPISYQSKVRVVLDDLRTQATAYYYQVDRRSSDDTASFRADAIAAMETDGVARLQTKALGTNGTTAWTDADSTLAVGAPVTILDRAGPGTITRLALDIDVAALDAVTLQMSWDDQTTAALDVPLGALFANDPSPASFDTLPMSVHVEGTTARLTLTLPMPFASHALISLTNTGSTSLTVHAHVDGVSSVPAGTFGNLHGLRSERASPGSGDHYTVADLTGRGKYVGTVVNFTGRADEKARPPSPFNFLEGDPTATADGATVVQGTGTEEFFDGGWYFDTGPFAAPFSAVSSVTGDRTSGVKGTGQIAAVRWNLLGNAIDFQQSFHLDWEYGANTPSTALDYVSVALYYADGT